VYKSWFDETINLKMLFPSHKDYFNILTKTIDIRISLAVMSCRSVAT